MLLALYRETLHGYGMIKMIEEVSGGQYTIAPGTLYGVLKNLEKQGLIETVKAEQDRRKKKTYRITPKGQELLEAEFERYERIMAITTKIRGE